MKKKIENILSIGFLVLLIVCYLDGSLGPVEAADPGAYKEHFWEPGGWEGLYE